MAVTTLKPNINIKNLTAQQKSIKKEVKNVDVVSTKIKSSLFRRNKFKKESISRLKFLQNKRDQQTLRQEREDIIESSGISGATRRVRNIVAESSRGFLGRILDFIGTLLVGWLLNNLPTILTMAKELIARIRRMFSLLTEFVQNLTSTFFNFGQLLGAVYKNVSSFDFFDTSGRVSDALTELQKNFDAMGSQFDEGTKLVTTPLSEGMESGEDAAPFGTDYTVTPGTAGTSGRLQPIHKQALDIISGPESGGDYNAMNNGKAGDRLGGSKKWLGKNLTDMTIGEVKYYQNVKKTLWAAGRYQIIPISLPTAQKAAGLKDSDKFDKNNQDLLAIGLLKVQGPGAWTKYSKYTKEQIDIMYKAKNTPLGPAVSAPVTPSAPGPTVTTTVKDEINVSGPSGGTRTVGLTPGQGFGYSASRGRMHEGIDIGTSGEKGWYVSLRKTGKVVFAGTSGGYGNVVDIVGPDGTCYRFAHLAKMMVRQGSTYNGQTIGEIGTTGRSSNIHLHFEVRPGGPFGKAIDPKPYLGLLSIGRQLTGIAGQQAAAPANAKQTAAPAQIAAQQPTAPSLATPAQIATQTPQRQQQLAQQVTPQRTGQQIVVIDDVQPSAPQMPMAAPSSQQPTIILLDPLNRMMKNKLLLDLAYT